MASPLRVRKILNGSLTAKQNLLMCGSQHSSCLNRQIVSWILHNPFKIIYILSHMRLQHFPDGNYSKGLPGAAVWKSLILHFAGSSQRQGAEPASWSRGSVSPWSTASALRGSVFHSGLLNCTQAWGRQTCLLPVLEHWEIGRLLRNCPSNEFKYYKYCINLLATLVIYELKGV